MGLDWLLWSGREDLNLRPTTAALGPDLPLDGLSFSGDRRQAQDVAGAVLFVDREGPRGAAVGSADDAAALDVDAGMTEPVADFAQGAGRVFDLDDHARAGDEGVTHAFEHVGRVLVAAVGVDLGAGQIADGRLVDLDDVHAARTQSLGQMGQLTRSIWQLNDELLAHGSLPTTCQAVEGKRGAVTSRRRASHRQRSG